MEWTLTLAALLVGAGLQAPARESSATPRELGRVRWGHDLDHAFERSRSDGRPVALLFDEVPGCATCVGFGRQVLGHPLIADALESEFVPVFVANNRPGRDAESLARFREPAWNNPVLRLLDARGRDLIPRADGVYAPHEITARLVKSLSAARRPVPGYLVLASLETRIATRSEAAFAMHCFWEGEAQLGGLDGVIAVEAFHWQGHEAVRVVFDESALPYERLVREAEERDCADRVIARTTRQYDVARRIVGARAVRSDATGRPAAAGDHEHALSASPLRWLPLTAAQAARVNAALATGAAPERWLSPRQRALAAEIALVAHDAPARLAGLERPAEFERLEDYEARLVGALAAAH